MQQRSWYPKDPGEALALADGIVIVLFAVVLFVVLALVAILVGRWRSWHWIGNPWFRLGHTALIVFIASQAAAGRLCPLTIWERELRWQAGVPMDDTSFVARWAHDLLFIEASPLALAVSYGAFAGLTVLSWYFAPVRWRRRPKEGR